jgi:hypothetical protein|uniref:Uncharacterized protein n=1 Tax=Bionectria ochroleuca TaxID=29856 RepID=A0A8H7N9Z5_BIOOC
MAYQSNMQAQDELAALLSRTIFFNPDVQVQVPAPEPEQAVVYSASQHYNHSSHITRPVESSNREDIPRSASVPPHGDNAASEHILRIHGIDPQTLTPSQLQLFKVADAPQQRRLLELWSICPPKNGGDIPSLAWSSTTLEHEEQLARVRYESQQQEEAARNAPVQAQNGQWHQQESTDSEPYMLSGYEELMRREREREQERQSYTTSPSRNAYGCFATAQAMSGPTYSQAMDPVYQGPDYIREQQQMEMATQYGAFQQFGVVGQGDGMDF